MTIGNDDYTGAKSDCLGDRDEQGEDGKSVHHPFHRSKHRVRVLAARLSSINIWIRRVYLFRDSDVVAGDNTVITELFGGFTDFTCAVYFAQGRALRLHVGHNTSPLKISPFLSDWITEPQCRRRPP